MDDDGQKWQHLKFLVFVILKTQTTKTWGSDARWQTIFVSIIISVLNKCRSVRIGQLCSRNSDSNRQCNCGLIKGIIMSFCYKFKTYFTLSFGEVLFLKVKKFELGLAFACRKVFAYCHRSFLVRQSEPCFSVHSIASQISLQFCCPGGPRLRKSGTSSQLYRLLLCRVALGSQGSGKRATLDCGSC